MGPSERIQSDSVKGPLFPFNFTIIAHFVPGQRISGFAEQTRTGYQSAQLIGWGALDLAHALHFTPDFAPWEGDMALMPKSVARLPLTGAHGFRFPKIR